MTDHHSTLDRSDLEYLRMLDYSRRLRAERRRRLQLQIRAAVRVAFWSLFAVVVWIGVSSVDEQRDGWWVMYIAAVLLLIATAVVVHLGSRAGSR